MSLTQYNYGAGDWAEFVSRCEKTGKGLIALSLTNYDNNNACEIAEGSVVEINGAVFRQESGNTAITGTPANNVINYILMSAANNAAMAAWNSSTPSWNTAYQGYYEGNNRYIGGCYYDGNNYAIKWVYNGFKTGAFTENTSVPLVGYSDFTGNIHTYGSFIYWTGNVAGNARLPIVGLQNNDIVTELWSYCHSIAGGNVTVYLRKMAYSDNANSTNLAITSHTSSGANSNTTVSTPIIDMDTNKYYAYVHQSAAYSTYISGIRIQYTRIYR